MIQAVRKRVRVQAGGIVAVQDTSLPEGAEAEVIVLLTETAEGEVSEELPPLESMFGAAKGVFNTPEEVDQYIRNLRDEWD